MGRAKERLQRIYSLDMQIRRRLEDIDTLKQEMTRLKAIDYTREKVQTAAEDGASYERIVERLIDMERDLSYRIGDLAVLREIIIEEIERVPNQMEAQVLHCRYVRLMPWKDIADELYISERHLRRVHGRALASYEQLVFGDECIAY